MRDFQRPTMVASGRKERRGSVILLVLITIFFAAYAISKFVERASVEMLAESKALDHKRLRVEAYSALEVTLAVLQDFRAVNGSWHGPADGWGDPLNYADYTPPDGIKIDVTFEDESGKLSLPKADAVTLQKLFESFGMQKLDYDRLTDALMGWMKKDYTPTSGLGVTAFDYDTGQLPYQPPYRSLHSFGELADIQVARDFFYDENHQPTDLYQRFVSSVSLYSFNAPNLNGGNAGVLAAVGGYDERQQQAVSDYLSGQGNWKSSGPGVFQNQADALRQLALPAPRSPLGTEILALRINITVHQGLATFHLSSVITPAAGGASAPPKTVAAATNVNQQVQATATAAKQVTTNAQTAAQNLNYPFKVLEIRENDEISQPVVPPPSA